MFDIASTELLIICVVALVIIGPKDLPKVMRTVGNWIGQARGMARHFRTGMDAMMREAELEEMEKKWKADNERIMREHPAPPTAAAEPVSDWGKAAPEASAPVAPSPPAAPALHPPAPPSREAPPPPSADRELP
jgi:sec-independent protein translocase protein TatB